MQTEKQAHYTFLIRLWREKTNGKSVWRGSVINIQSGERKYFQSITGLAELIAQVVGTHPNEEGGASSTVDENKKNNL